MSDSGLFRSAGVRFAAVYPLLLAGVFRVFGIFTPLSAWVILAINCVFSAFTAMSVWEIGYRFAGRRCGLWAGCCGRSTRQRCSTR